MKGFRGNIGKDALENKEFRKVLYTGIHGQLVLMSLPPPRARRAISYFIRHTAVKDRRVSCLLQEVLPGD